MVILVIIIAIMVIFTFIGVSCVIVGSDADTKNDIVQNNRNDEDDKS